MQVKAGQLMVPIEEYPVISEQTKISSAAKLIVEAFQKKK